MNTLKKVLSFYLLYFSLKYTLKRLAESTINKRLHRLELNKTQQEEKKARRSLDKLKVKLEVQKSKLSGAVEGFKAHSNRLAPAVIDPTEVADIFSNLHEMKQIELSVEAEIGEIEGEMAPVKLLISQEQMIALLVERDLRKLTPICVSTKNEIILGSSSVHRQKVLAEMGYDFTIMTADIDEKSIRRNTPEEMVMAIAEAKDVVAFSSLGVVEEVLHPAEAIIAKLPINYCKQDAEPPLLITGDQMLSLEFFSFCILLLSSNALEVVVYEGKVREKPSSKEEARQFIKGYSSGTAGTVSSVLVTNLKSGLSKGDWEKAEIHFHAIPDQVVDNLIQEKMVLNVAGALISEHPLLLPYVKQLVGTTESMMGLPKALTERLILEAL
ncbi:hypothetical protein RHSIM_Rhsim07G0240500 [Rhododendron simsii]|uniref:Maf-like protein n=1 Tax=Rhododendron simsii TaxID=118357 RepID=A0A834GV14_RHOSS|nr:hypothetical protein RHSIM_Rhsim07G0240500 [Rhododendron simsii]